MPIKNEEERAALIARRDHQQDIRREHNKFIHENRLIDEERAMDEAKKSFKAPAVKNSQKSKARRLKNKTRKQLFKGKKKGHGRQ